MKEGQKTGLKLPPRDSWCWFGRNHLCNYWWNGIAATGTAVGITLGPLMTIGAGVGLTGYGIYWLGKQIGKGQKQK
jgi:hypothetical protein